MRVSNDSASPLYVELTSGSVSSSGGLTDTELRATPVPVSGTVTANLSATDNAVLDTIDAVLDTINGKLVSGTDIGDVTINNGGSGSAVNVQDGGNSLTIDGTVTAELSATDNAVLDVIAAAVGTIDGAKVITDAAGTLLQYARGLVTLVASNTPSPVVGVTVNVDATPTLTVHATYATGDYVGTSGSPMVFSGVSRAVNSSGFIVGALLTDYAAQSIAGELWLFDTNITPPDDSAAWTLSDAHAATCVGVIPFTTYYASAANSVSPAPNLSIPFLTKGGTDDLFGCFVTRGAPTYASGDLTFRLFIAQD